MFWSLLSVVFLLNLSHLSKSLVIKILNPCAIKTVNTPKRQGHPISRHINTMDKTDPRGFVMRDWKSQNLDECVGQIIKQQGRESQVIPLSYFVDVITGGNISRVTEKGTAREACRIMFRIFPIDAGFFGSLGRSSILLKGNPIAPYRRSHMNFS